MTRQQTSFLFERISELIEKEDFNGEDLLMLYKIPIWRLDSVKFTSAVRFSQVSLDTREMLVADVFT
eukprot:767620-Hanusia_phi.AAC.9